MLEKITIKLDNMSKKIAFIKAGSFSHINGFVEQMLANQFSDFEVETIDVKDLFKNRVAFISAGLFFMFKENGLNLLFRRKNLRQSFYTTSYMFRKIKALVSKRISSDHYAFTFQTQSLFDASVKSLPHFTYVDHTSLANSRYPSLGHKGMTFSKAWLELEKTIYKNAQINFTTSNFASNSIIEDYLCDADKVVCVYSGINVETTFEPGKKQFKDKNILFVGMDWERKGGPELVEAFKSVLQVHPEAILTIVGCKPRVNVRNCRVIGIVPREEVSQYYEQATVFCMPSRLEPSATVLAEASAWGLPIVSTNVGGTTDRILDGETGYLVNSGDVTQLAQALIDLLADPEKCRTLGENGYRRAMELFSWDNVGRKIEKTIECVINNVPA